MKNEYTYRVGEELKTVTIESDGDCFRVQVGENSYTVSVQRLGDGQFSFVLEDRRLVAYVARADARRYVAVAGRTWSLERLTKQPRRSRVGGHDGHDTLAATMPGQVLDVLAAEGDLVERGQTLLLLEAMKMELRITAPHAGQVSRIHCQKGQVVERGQVLVEIEEDHNT